MSLSRPVQAYQLLQIVLFGSETDENRIIGLPKDIDALALRNIAEFPLNQRQPGALDRHAAILFRERGLEQQDQLGPGLLARTRTKESQRTWQAGSGGCVSHLIEAADHGHL